MIFTMMYISITDMKTQSAEKGGKEYDRML